MALAPPDELPVYDYRQWLDQIAAKASQPDFTIDQLSTTSTATGDTAIVKLDASGTMGSGDEAGKWQVGGTCPNEGSGWLGFDASSSDAPEGIGRADGTPPTELCLAGDLGDALPFGLFITDTTSGTRRLEWVGLDRGCT